MNKKRAEELGGRLSYPSKMDVAAWGIPATRCRIGSLLAKVEGSTCSDPDAPGHEEAAPRVAEEKGRSHLGGSDRPHGQDVRSFEEVPTTKTAARRTTILRIWSM